MNKVTPFLMFNDQLEPAIEFYTSTFPNSEVRKVARTGKDGPISSAEFVVGGQLFMGYNGGPYFSEGVSLCVDCADHRFRSYGIPYPGPRTTRPGFAPVAFPSSTTGAPFTSTYFTPTDN